jgi:hypothetical protein
MRVGEAKQRDVGKKRARIGPQAMDHLHVTPGDVIEIIGTKSSCVVIWPVDEDEKFQDIIRIDGQTRKNAEVSLNDFVKIKSRSQDCKDHIAGTCKRHSHGGQGVYGLCKEQAQGHSRDARRRDIGDDPGKLHGL